MIYSVVPQDCVVLFISSASPAWPDHREEEAGCTAGLNTLQSCDWGGSALGRQWK